MQIKICTQCGVEKEISEFNKDKSRKDGLVNQCKDCQKKYLKKYYLLNITKFKEKAQINKDKISIYQKEWREKNKEKISNDFKNWVLNNKDYRCTYMKQYFRNKLNTDINFKLASHMRTRINLALNGNWKSGHTLKLLGCSIEFLKKYLEAQFTEGMSWTNHTLDGWHIDHIIPCAKFDLINPEEQRKCFHYTNLQPLWAKENLLKGIN
jgi:hypothetical protein